LGGGLGLVVPRGFFLSFCICFGDCFCLFEDNAKETYMLTDVAISGRMNV